MMMMMTKKSTLKQFHRRVKLFVINYQKIHMNFFVDVKRFRSENDDKTSNSNSVSSLCQDVLPKLMTTVSVIEQSTS